MTNRDILNKLSNEQLIESLCPLNCPPSFGFCGKSRCEKGRYTPDNGGCDTCWVDWLGEEAVGNAE